MGLLLFSGEQRGSSVLAFSLDLLYSERQKNEGRARPVQTGCLQCQENVEDARNRRTE